MSLSVVRALTFDVYGTVVDWRGSLLVHLRKLGEERGVDIPWDKFVDEWKRCYRPGMDAVNSGAVPWRNVNAIYRERLDGLLAESGLDNIDEEIKRRISRFWHLCDPWPDVAAELERLKRKYVLATLSNADVAAMIAMARRGAITWDCVLCAEIFRTYKPAPEVYLGAADLLGLAPEEIMMVAAHNYDLKAARSHGMRTAFVARPREYGPSQTTDLVAEEAWDLIVSDFKELAGALGT